MSEYRDRAHIKSYVRRAVRMSEHQRRAYDRLCDRYCVPRVPDPIDARKLFSNGNDRLVVEIGFGMGAATAELASALPQTNFLGVEVYKPGVGKLLAMIEERGLENILIVHDDAILVMEQMIAERTLDGLHVFFPDPWPKKRHHKRRIIRPELASVFARRIKPGGYFYMVTDWEEYALDALEVLSATPELVNPSPGFSKPIEWRPRTAFEEKAARAGRPVRELYFERLPLE